MQPFPAGMAALPVLCIQRGKVHHPRWMAAPCPGRFRTAGSPSTMPPLLQAELPELSGPIAPALSGKSFFYKQMPEDQSGGQNSAKWISEALTLPSARSFLHPAFHDLTCAYIDEVPLFMRFPRVGNAWLADICPIDS